MTQAPSPKTAEQIIRNLHNFNRKERDRLMKFALCDDDDLYPRISVELWKLVRTKDGRQQRPKPEQMFLGMDYHLNWLYAALVATTCDKEELRKGVENSWKFTSNKNLERPIQGNQQDVDLLVAW